MTDFEAVSVRGEPLPSVAKVFSEELSDANGLASVQVVSYSTAEERKGTLILLTWRSGVRLLLQECYGSYWLVRFPLCEAHPFHGPATVEHGLSCEACGGELDELAPSWGFGAEEWAWKEEDFSAHLAEELSLRDVLPLEAVVISLELTLAVTAARRACQRAFGFF